MLKAFKVRLYPNKTQATYFAKAIGSCRVIYNMMLHDAKEAYFKFVAEEEGMSEDEKKRHKHTYKIHYSTYPKQEQTSYLKEIEARALNYVQQNLNTAYKNFFTNRKKGVGFPTFKKKSFAGSFQSDNISVVGHKLKVPKCPGLVKFRNYAEVDFSLYTTKTITISRSSSGKYFASILCVVPDIEPLPKTGKIIGIDLGESTPVTCDDGRKIDRESITTKDRIFKGNSRKDTRINTIRNKIEYYQTKLAKAGIWTNVTFTGKDGKTHEKRKLVEKTRNYIRYERTIAKLYEKLYNIRRNFINNTAKFLVKDADVICMENLTIKSTNGKNGMLADDTNLTNNQNATKHRNIAEASMGMIADKIKQMASLYDKQIIGVDPKYTTMTCNCCGYRLTEKLATSIRSWYCPKCGVHHDRDINAAKNILKLGIAKMKEMDSIAI